jgi:Arc/MetJ-type ribon-helix-helix transcriptional regulator
MLSIMPTSNGKMVRTTVLVTKSQMDTVLRVVKQGRAPTQSEAIRYIINKYGEREAAHG